ncbi:imelysin family protein [Oryzibacter oryziterrae]|uniref:imelysin family protein n=1 Tax=Oryzibacter oryziterrae TaxID=2766474 RepID=UPI001F394AC0|nr:imelysin family protein [Oryzibacter oryziterrae]
MLKSVLPVAEVRRRLLGLIAGGLTSLALIGPGAAEDMVIQAKVLTEADYAKLAASVIDGQVRPSYEGFEMQSELLAANLGRFCAAPTDAGLTDVKRAFEGTLRGFFSLLPVKIGPLMEEHRLERLSFWPDPRGLGLKPVNQILAKSDPTALDPATLPQKSVGAQGLTALEFVLYGDGAATLLDKANPQGAFRCSYGKAISVNVHNMAAEMAAAWAPDGAATRLVATPSAQNPQFQTHKEVVGKLLNTLTSGLESVVEDMITTPFGKTEDVKKPRLAPYWRSGMSLSVTEATLDASLRILEVASLETYIPKNETWIANSIQFELRNTSKTLNKITDSMPAAADNPQDRKVVEYVRVALHNLKKSIGRDLTASLGVEAGFNANDGD